MSNYLIKKFYFNFLNIILKIHITKTAKKYQQSRLVLNLIVLANHPKRHFELPAFNSEESRGNKTLNLSSRPNFE